MYRFVLLLLAVLAALGVSVGTGDASSSLRDSLGERFKLSRIEVQNPSGEGHVIKKGTVLSLQAERVPANPLRVVQLNTKSPRFHVADYARVKVDREGQLTSDPGEMALPRGTRLVVLDLKVGADRVRLFTHTLEPMRLPGGKTATGCAEFVFVFDPATLNRADAPTVAGRINQWLSIESAA